MHSWNRKEAVTFTEYIGMWDGKLVPSAATKASAEGGESCAIPLAKALKRVGNDLGHHGGGEGTICRTLSGIVATPTILACKESTKRRRSICHGLPAATSLQII